MRTKYDFSSVSCIVLILFYVLPNITADCVDTESYMDDLSEKLVENMKMNVNMLQLQDATSKISSTRFGVTMDCDVKFHSGFVASIGPAMTTKYKTTNVNDTYGTFMWEMSLLLKDVNIVYDIHSELKDKTTVDATFLITYSSMNFKISISGKNVDKSLMGKIVFDGGLTAKQIMIQMHPKTAPVQIIAREYRASDPKFRVPIESGFDQWLTVFQSSLDATLEEMEFPYVDYSQGYCFQQSKHSRKC